MSAGSTPGAEILFHPPGCNPFYAPASPKTHYFPSNLQQQNQELKNTILTPEKLSKVQVKDNRSYIPLNYSFSEEEPKEIITTVEKRLAEADSLDCANLTKSQQSSHHFFKQWKTNENLVEPQILEPSNSTTELKFNQSKHSASKLDSELSSFDEQPYPHQTTGSNIASPKMSSTQKTSSPSNISMLVNRFRYGKPLPPIERKRANDHNKISSHSRGHSTSTSYSKKSTLHSTYMGSKFTSDLTPDLSSIHDDSISELQSRVDRILKDSTSTFNSESSSQPLSPVTTSHEILKRSDFRSLVSHSTTACSSSSSNKSHVATTDHLSTTTPTSFVKQSILSGDYHTPESTENKSSHRNPSLPTTGLIQEPSGQQALPHQSAHLTPRHPYTSDLSFQDDILQQWRLRRKLETARAASTNRFWSDDFSKSNHPQSNQLRFAPAERPLVSQHPDFRVKELVVVDAQNSDKRNVGISVVPTTCAQTQTSPDTSLKADDKDNLSAEPQVPVIQVKKRSNISMHKVAVTQSETHDEPSSPISHSTDTWGDLSLRSKFNDVSTHASTVTSTRDENRPSIEDAPSSIASPTTTAVKQVIVDRLFNISEDASRNQGHSPKLADKSEDSFELSVEHTTSIKPVSEDTPSLNQSHNSCSSGQTQHDGGQQIMLQKILQCIDEEPDDFHDDPVLKSLKDQRSKYLQALRTIENKLEKIETKEHVHEVGKKTPLD